MNNLENQYSKIHSIIQTMCKKDELDCEYCPFGNTKKFNCDEEKECLAWLIREVEA